MTVSYVYVFPSIGSFFLSHVFCPNRLALAALHFNENSSREQAVTSDGEERYDILFPKYKKGGHIVRKVTVNPTYSKHLHLLITKACLNMLRLIYWLFFSFISRLY